jgi:hypothetical protein
VSVLSVAALLVALLVAAPVVAHLLRRRQAEERPFPAAALVPATPPQARKRSALEDRALFSVRALAVIGLALLGATPFVRCSRVALNRQGGASVAMAVVLDDSLSMRAPLPGGEAGSTSGPTRFQRARQGALELLDGTRSGDAVAVVMAGAPARVLVAATTNVATAREAIEAAEPSDRATDLDESVRLGRELLDALPQSDKRVVVFSDLADGSAEGTVLAAEGTVATWVPLGELAGLAEDCAVTRADRAANKVLARVVCTGAGTAAPSDSAAAQPSASAAPEARPGAPTRLLELRAGDEVLASARVSTAEHVSDVTLELRAEAPEGLVARLAPGDAIAADDVAPVVAAGGSLEIAVVGDAAGSHVETGGPPPVEQALTALELDARIHPLPSVPEHAEDLGNFGALIVDDQPGLTPEVRRALAAWVEKGGVVLLALGPRAAAAQLGATFEPLVAGVVRWGKSPSPGIDPATAAAALGAAAPSYADLSAKGRASLDAGASDAAEVLARWQDGAPFLLRRPMGRGSVLVLTLPFDTEQSDLALRPAFLAIVDRFVSTARARGGARRIDAGQSWTFDGFQRVRVRRLGGAGADAEVPVLDADGRPRAAPPLAGSYEIDLGDEKVTRVAAVPEREIDFRPRPVSPSAASEVFGGVAPSMDVSPWVAVGLLALLAVEMALRVARRARAGAAPVVERTS